MAGITRRILRGFAPGLFTLFLGLSAQAQTAVQLTPEQLRNAAFLALQQYDAPRALTYSDALLKRDPNDRTALLINARAARDLGKFGQAKKSARSAWSLSTTKEQKYASSIVMAQALSSAGQRTLAQLWLRRAVEHAPTKAHENKAVQDFRYVRSRNPWLTRVSFSITPDSNINNGSSSRSSFLNYQLSELLFGQPAEYELSGTAVALSGIEYAFGLVTRYRFKETARRAHDIVFTTDIRHYTLSEDAKSLAPGAQGSDFAFASYTLGYGQRGFNFGQSGEYRVLLDVGQSWYSGSEYAQFARLSAGQTYTFDSGERINVRLSGEHQIGIQTADTDSFRSDFSYSRFLRNGAFLWTSFTAGLTTSPTPSEEFTEVALRAQLTLAKPIYGATVMFGMWMRNRDYDVSPHDVNGRTEDRIQADLTLIFRKIDYYGFNPTLRLSASKTDSNVALYDARRIGVNIGIQSAF